MREAPLEANARCMEREEDDESAKTRVADVSGETTKDEGRDTTRPTRLILFVNNKYNLYLYF
jgi:hypothetical protein